ncbi:beta-1,3-glucanase family protein [Lacipirellula sp.]|uniref:beta-1,3-glucanase family protein n=1 Tax=Lacipirellula sp. TaxID=2691419 RepID=UPI003D14F548
MGLKRRRQRSANRHNPRFRFEPLERRDLMSGNQVISITSGTTYNFRDADGTKVAVKLMGPGSGQMTLTNGQLTGGSIDWMTLSGTTSTSQLKITASGGTDNGSTMNSLTVFSAINSQTALKQFSGSGITLSPNGEILLHGNVGDSFAIDNVGANALIDVEGTVATFTAGTMHSNSSLTTDGMITSLNIVTMNAGSKVLAPQVGKVKVTGTATGAEIAAGIGGMQSVFFQSVVNSNVYTSGNIGSVVIQAASNGSVLAANRSPGTDNVFGTIDDFTMGAMPSVGSIGTVTLNGAVSTLQLLATGTVGAVTVPNGQSQPTVVDDVMSSFIPLEIAQAVAEATGYDDDEVWIAVFGQEIPTPAQGATPTTGVSYHLDAGSLSPVGPNGQPTPIPISTATLEVGINTPNQAILPSSTIAEWANASSTWGSNLQFPIPAPGNQFTGRIVISVGAPVQAQVNSTNGSVSAPSASSSTDPSTGTFYDFLEFTVTNTAGVPSLDIDTSQVDAFGLPMTLQFFKDVQATQPFNAGFTGVTTNLSNVVTVLQGMSGLKVGQVVTGNGIPTGTLIDSINTGAGTIKLSAAATATSSAQGALLQALNGGPVGVDGTRNEILHNESLYSLAEFLNQEIGAGHTGARPFLQSASPFEVAGGVPITGVTTASSTVTITTDSTAGLVAGYQVFISGVQGATAANGLFTIGNVTANTFTLNGLTSAATYVAGGEWSLAITGASNPGANQPIVITASSTAGLQQGDLVEISGVAGNTYANGFYYISNVTATTFELDGSDGSSANAYTSGGTWRVYESGTRLVSPKDIVEALPNAQSSNKLNNYYNEYIDQFFLKYLPSSQYVTSGGQNVYGGGDVLQIESTASGSKLTYSGTVKQIAGLGYVLYLTTPSEATPYLVFYPFTASNLPNPTDYVPLFPTVAAPTWLVCAGLEGQSASQMLFACDGFFADNTFRAEYYKSNNLPSYWSAVLGDLENSIAAAFNRGIALEPGTSWGDRSTWFQQNSGQNGNYNYWVQYWHESGLAVNDLAYAFPYDDKYGSSTNLNVANVGLARVLLNSWSASQLPSTTTFTTIPASAQQGGPITLKAHVAPSGANPTPTGTVTFFIDGVAINSNDFSSSPPWQPVTLDGSGNATISATLPALADGSTTHTYTVTAVYSGDVDSAPSIASQSLKLVGVNGDFLMTLNPDLGPLGTSVNVTATLPGHEFSGTVTFSASLSDGSGSQQLGPPVPVSGPMLNTNITIPSSLLTFTGDMLSGHHTITNISNAVNLEVGQSLTSPQFTGGQEITGITMPSVTLDKSALLTGTVTFISNGVTFTATATKNSFQLTGINTLNGLTPSAVTQVTGNSQLLQASTTITMLNYGSVTVQGTANTTATGASFVSDGALTVFPITAHFVPLVGQSYTAFMGYEGPSA